MNKSTLAVTLLTSAGVVAAGAFLLRSSDNKGDAPVSAVETKSDKLDADGRPIPDIIKNNATKVVDITVENKIRDYKFEKLKDGLRAEGVELNAAGEVVFTSQHTGGKIEQKLVRAGAHKDGQLVRALDKSETVQANVRTGDTYGSVTYDSYFDGLGLEYKYDGQAVEEFFHMSDDLKAELVKKGADLRVTTLIPDLFRDDGVFVMDRQGNSAQNDYVDEPEKREAASHSKYMNGDIELYTGELELNTKGHRFVFPSAVAFDAKKNRKDLDRELVWTTKGLELTTIVPASWLSKAEGTVVIDPSIVESNTAVNLLTWNERNIVKDSMGWFHVAYMAIFNGRWRSHHTRSQDGVVWEDATVIQPTYGPGENTHYTPTLAIDGQDTLHVVFADHGHIPSYPAPGGINPKGSYTAWGHRLRHSYCLNRCNTKEWLPQNERDQLIAGTSAAHQRHYHAAIDGNNMLHMGWFENGGGANLIRYFQRSQAGVFSERQAPGFNYYHNHFVVDTNQAAQGGQVHFLGANRYGDTLVHHYVLDRNTNTWQTRPFLDIRAQSTGNGGRTRAYQSNASVDANNNIHYISQSYNAWGGTHSTTGAAAAPTHGIAYGRYDNATQTWVEIGFVREPDMVNRVHEQSPSVTVDAAGRAHVVWEYSTQPQPYILYSFKDTGSATWSAATQLLFSFGRQSHPQLRPRLSYPAGPNNVVTDGNSLDVLIKENDSVIQYFSTGAPVAGPQPSTPLDHTFIADTTPTFEWQRLSSDNGSNMSYTIQVSPTPIFTGCELATPVNCIVATTAGGATTYTVPAGSAIPDGQYRYWRVQGFRPPSGLPGPFGPIYEIGVDTSPPAQFDLTAPADNTDPGTRTPTFQWNAAVDN